MQQRQRTDTFNPRNVHSKQTKRYKANKEDGPGHVSCVCMDQYVKCVFDVANVHRSTLYKTTMQSEMTDPPPAVPHM